MDENEEDEDPCDFEENMEDVKLVKAYTFNQDY